MNIFATSACPDASARCLPDRHIVKMPLECCQMLSMVASRWLHGYGVLRKADTTPYATERGAYRAHPCTLWAATTRNNARWLIAHGRALCDEFTYRYGKRHACEFALEDADGIFPQGEIGLASGFVRAMPDIFRLNNVIDTFEAYRRYVASKPWVAGNYVRAPERKPEWVARYNEIGGTKHE
jgi:hypothetical protein